MSLLTLATISDALPKGLRYPLLAGAIALAVSWVLTPHVRNLAIHKGAIDDPNRDDRRIHKEPLPRWGGIAIYAGILIALIAVLPFANPSIPFPPYLIAMLVISGGLVGIGALDDLYQYKAKIQALLLLLAGVAVQLFYDPIGMARVQINTLGIPLSTPGQYIALGALAIPLTAFYIFVVTKTMDTIDGVDGLAAGIAAISAGTLVLIAAYSGQPRVAIVAATIAGSAIGFLKHNYNPAKIIMGTGGAYVLGFMLACISIVGAFKTAAAVSLLLPVLVFGVPIFDAFFVITRRLMSGEPITQADKRHLHHTLLGKGLSQRQTVWVLYAAAATLCAVALFMVRSK
ncbi:glycosyltransferase family 4 protein [Fimbriimonas ginsengisoli]|uniref:Glycosyl transferase family protein n=1 Tax=Fimbriimonas ginsengisoli Gsoil 348 TaxID=661478 RepID=A0A068NXL7_FIMGI|nr:MraY family glycosyltransferase [Fimbriimonas ginsengisoli]AIE86384.1 glycosyl transferase family protein [Fimbriimonas ginsengisoli Gsoil 348]